MVTDFDTPTGGDDLVGQLTEQLTRAFRRIRHATRAELAPHGITFAQARVLRTLDKAGLPMRVGDIAASIEIAPRSATSMVDALESAGLVRRGADPSDRRSVRVQMTEDGRALLGRVRAARRAGAEQLFGGLRREQQAQLLALLDALNSVERDAQAAPAGGEAR